MPIHRAGRAVPLNGGRIEQISNKREGFCVTVKELRTACASDMPVRITVHGYYADTKEYFSFRSATKDATTRDEELEYLDDLEVEAWFVSDYLNDGLVLYIDAIEWVGRNGDV